MAMSSIITSAIWRSLDRPGDRARSPEIAEVVQLDREVGHQADRDHREQLGHRQRAVEQELPDQHGRGLAGDLGPAQAREPLDVDPVAIRDRGEQRHAPSQRSRSPPGRRRYCCGRSSCFRPLSSTTCW